jgi:GNAT superfamily N-acetyltransferase
MDELKTNIAGLELKPITQEDIPALLGLLWELAVYEHLEDIFTVNEEILLESFFETHSAEAFLAVMDGKAVGYSIYFMNFSSFLGRAGMYLEDLYVQPDYRGHGIGLAMIRAVARIAVSRGCQRFEWVCLNWNVNSIKFYKSLGAVGMDEWTTYRVAGEKLIELAK